MAASLLDLYAGVPDPVGEQGGGRSLMFPSRLMLPTQPEQGGQIPADELKIFLDELLSQPDVRQI
jgi:hypothetical protein